MKNRSLCFLLIGTFINILLHSCYVYFWHQKNAAALDGVSVLDLSLPSSVFIVIGVSCSLQDIKRRHAIRSTYRNYRNVHKFGTSSGTVALIFVTGQVDHLRYDPTPLLYSFEIEREKYHDVYELDILENMDEGKTYHHFSFAWHVMSTHPNIQFWMKADTDLFVRTIPLEAFLRSIPPGPTYIGNYVNASHWTTPLDKRLTHVEYAYGAGYILQRDLVEWVATSNYPKVHQNGYEDMMVGAWFALSGEREVVRVHTDLIHDWLSKRTASDRVHRKVDGDSLAVHNCKDEGDFYILYRKFRNA